MLNKLLSNRVSEWSVLPTASHHGKIVAMQHAGKKIIDLTIGISNVPIPKEGSQAAIRAIKTNNVPYTAIGGMEELKTVLQKKLDKENAIRAHTSNILVTTGAKQAIFQALYALTDPNDEVALFRPYWPAFTQILTMLKLKPRFIDLNDIPLLPTKTLGKQVKVLIVNNPHNPTGKIFNTHELETVALFAKKNNLIVIADESYEKLIYEGNYKSFSSIVDAKMREKLITTFSASQSFSMMGWRFGYAVANKEIIAAMEAVQSSITAATSAITQTAVTNSLPKERYYVKKLQDDFRKRRDTIYEKISQIHWITCAKPQSGPYFWCNIEKLTKNSMQFVDKLLEQQKVAVMPGEIFGTPGLIRIAFNVQSIPVLEEAVKRIAAFGDYYESK